MVHAIRKLAREIHRRSVWQVLGAYGVGSWAVVSGLESLATRIGLPLWTGDMATALLLIGLPVVLATAVVQNGLPWLRIEDVEDPNELVGRTPAQVHVVPEAHPLYGRSLFTWRNAVLGGVMATALLATSVVAYLTMWALGIGPVGSLMAQGYIERDDRVILAEFENRTDDAALSARVRRTFSDGLSASTVVQLVESGLFREAALLAAARDEVKLVLDGHVMRVGAAVRVTVFIVAADGTMLGRFEDMAHTDEDLAPRVADLSDRVRERLGEPLRVIRTGR